MLFSFFILSVQYFISIRDTGQGVHKLTIIPLLNPILQSLTIRKTAKSLLPTSISRTFGHIDLDYLSQNTYLYFDFNLASSSTTIEAISETTG